MLQINWKQRSLGRINGISSVILIDRGDGMGSGRDKEVIGCIAFAVKSPHRPSNSFSQGNDLCYDERWIILSFTGFLT